MNRLVPQKAVLFDLTHALREEVLATIGDTDLGFGLGGKTLGLHRLLLEQGEIQAAYTRLFQTSKLRFDVAAPDDLKTTAQLRDWFVQLDAQMWTALEVLSDEDLDRAVRRGRHALPLGVTFYTYRESVFIFAAKASVYLRALGHDLPPQLRGFVG